VTAPTWSSRSVYKGRKKGFEVRDFKRRVVGRFPTIKKAMIAIDESCAEPVDNG
jgi:hypothetical protein